MNAVERCDPAACEIHAIIGEQCRDCPDPHIGEPCSVCPPYVVRCAHLEGDPRVVWLADRRAYNDADCGGWNHIEPEKAFEATIGHPEYHPEFGCTCLRQASYVFTNTDTRAEADAAFARYEAILLGRTEEA